VLVAVSRAFPSRSATVVSSILFFCDHLSHFSHSIILSNIQFPGVIQVLFFHCTNPQDGVIKSYVKDKTSSDGMSGVKKNARVIRISHSRVSKVWRVKGKGSLGG